MILTSYYTGHGHASITNALKSALDNTNCQYSVVEMVDNCGWFLRKRCKAYGKTTSKRPWLWKIYYNLSNKFSRISNWLVRQSCQKKFVKQLFEFRPDVIVSVHPMFVGSVLSILKKRQLKSKFATVIADLVSINNLWLDTRADIVFFPTHEAIQIGRDNGILEHQIIQCTLPSRQTIIDKAHTISYTETDNNINVKCLVMSGGEGSGNIESTIDNILQHPKTSVHAILGRNQQLYNRLSTKYAHNHRVVVEGFATNIQDIIPTCDIAVVRGSPNVLMECINLLCPIITTDCLPGQEEGNDRWIYKNGFGLMCPDRSQLAATIDKYLQDNRQLLQQTRLNQYRYRDLNSANKIVQTIIDRFGQPMHM